MTHDEKMRVIREASTLLRRIDTLADGKPIDGTRARDLADGLVEIGNDIVVYAAQDRIRELAAGEFSVRVPEHGPLRLLRGGAA